MEIYMDGGDVGFLAVMVVACCSERGRNLLGDFWSVVAVMGGWWVSRFGGF